MSSDRSLGTESCSDAAFSSGAVFWRGSRAEHGGEAKAPKQEPAVPQGTESVVDGRCNNNIFRPQGLWLSSVELSSVQSGMIFYNLCSVLNAAPSVPPQHVCLDDRHLWQRGAAAQVLPISL